MNSNEIRINESVIAHTQIIVPKSVMEWIYNTVENIKVVAPNGSSIVFDFKNGDEVIFNVNGD